MSAAKALSGVAVVALLAGGLFAGDRYAEARAIEYTRDAVSDSMVVTQTPQVDIKGFPFLTQVLAGSLDEVTATIGGATLEGISVTDVDLVFQDVGLRPAAGKQPRAGHATISATIPTQSMGKVVRDRSGLVVTLEVKGSTLWASGDVLGLPLKIVLVPKVVDGKLLANVQDMTLGGTDVGVSSLPKALREGIQNLEIPVEGLPAGLSLTSAVVVPAGVRIATSGSNVEVPQPTAAGAAGKTSG